MTFQCEPVYEGLLAQRDGPLSTAGLSKAARGMLSCNVLVPGLPLVSKQLAPGAGDLAVACLITVLPAQPMVEGYRRRVAGRNLE